MLDKNKVVEIAKSQVGYHEKKSNKELESKTANSGSNNYTKYAEFFDDLRKQNLYVFNYEKNPAEWCAIFVIYCFSMAYGVETAMKMLFLPSRSSAAGCRFFAQYFRDKKAFKISPQVGDAIFFGKKGAETHVGLVTKVTDKMIYTVEGNSSDKVQEKSYKKTSVGSTIAGFGRPDWDYAVKAEKKEEDPKATSAPAPSAPTKKTLVADVKPALTNKTLAKTWTLNTTHGLNLRKGPGTNYSKFLCMPQKTNGKNTTVKCDGQYTGAWLFVTYEDKNAIYKGFAMKKWLK